MNRLAARWNDYWFRPVPALDLGFFRVLVASFHTFVLLFPHALLMYPPYTSFEALAAYPAETYHPPLVLKLLMLPFGGDGRPSVELLTIVYRAAIVFGLLATIGLFARTSCLLLALTSLFLVAHQFSYGEHHHVEAVTLIALVLLSVSRSGDSLSVDAWRKSRRTDPGSYAWPLLSVQWLLAMAYLSSASCKLGGGGLAWLNGTTLQYYVLQDALAWDLDAGRWLADRHGLCVALSWITLLTEALFFLVLIRPRAAFVFVPLAAAMHLGIFVTMRAPFFYYLPLFAAFVPWSRLLRRVSVAR